MTFEPVRTLADLNSLDVCDVMQGFADGRRDEPEPGGNRSRAYWHGWRVGMMDAGRIPLDQAQCDLVRAAAPNGRMNIADDRNSTILSPS